MPVSASTEYVAVGCSFNSLFREAWAVDALTWSDDRGLNVNDQERTRMSNQRIYVEGPIKPGTSFTIQGDQARYISRVRRLRAGDALVLFDGSGVEFPATITAFAKESVDVQIEECISRSAESPLAVTLVQGLSRGDRMDYVVQKATEMGVARIIPVSTDFSVVKLDDKRASKRVAHWRKVAASSCEQCGRNRLPHIDPPGSLLRVLGEFREDPVSKVVLQPGATRSLRAVDIGDGGLVVMIGPEGGFSSQELEHAGVAGFEAVGFGPRILRTETAAVAVLAAVQAMFGDLA